MNLVKKLQTKNEDAYQELVDTYSDTFFYLATQYIKNKEDVKDCVQDIYLKIYQNINKFKDDEIYFKPWVIALAKNQVIDSYRRLERNKERYVYDNDIINNTSGKEENSVGSVFLEALKAHVGEKGYEMLVYHLVTNMTFAEMGILFNEPKHTIRRRYIEVYEKAKIFIDEHGKELLYA